MSEPAEQLDTPVKRPRGRPRLYAASTNAGTPPRTDTERIRLALWYISRFDTVEDAEKAFSAAVLATKELHK